jgi:hypothetical protein
MFARFLPVLILIIRLAVVYGLWIQAEEQHPRAEDLLSKFIGMREGHASFAHSDPADPRVSLNSINVSRKSDGQPDCEILKGNVLPTRDIKKLELYHISKCGGNTLDRVFSGGLTLKGRTAYLGQKENACDPTFCGRIPSDTFILGTVRNPYDFYVSYWQMVLSEYPADPYDYACLGRMAKERNKQGIFSGKNNATSFKRWLHFVLEEMGGRCGRGIYGMGAIYENMMLFNSSVEYAIAANPAVQGIKQPVVVYDAIVRLEEFYSTLEQALIKFECFQPGSIDWRFFKRLRDNDYIAYRGKQRIPYHCFYDEEARSWVERHDKHVLEMHGYTFGPPNPDECLAAFASTGG